MGFGHCVRKFHQQRQCTESARNTLNETRLDVIREIDWIPNLFTRLKISAVFGVGNSSLASLGCNRSLALRNSLVSDTAARRLAVSFSVWQTCGNVDDANATLVQANSNVHLLNLIPKSMVTSQQQHERNSFATHINQVQELAPLTGMEVRVLSWALIDCSLKCTERKGPETQGLFRCLATDD